VARDRFAVTDKLMKDSEGTWEANARCKLYVCVCSPEHLQMVMLKGPTMVSNMMVKARLEGMPQAEQEALRSVEVSSACWMLAQDIARRVADDEGAALVIDYGHEGPFGDSLQVRSAVAINRWLWTGSQRHACERTCPHTYTLSHASVSLSRRPMMPVRSTHELVAAAQHRTQEAVSRMSNTRQFTPSSYR